VGTTRLELLGGFAVNFAGDAAATVRISSKKAAALLAYLAMRPNRSVDGRRSSRCRLS
jgi:DNA-binding SARP family transcriptional activator